MTRLGSYAIVRKLAKGGMAELFLARSSGPEGFEKLVVLKKILPKYAENPRFVQLFLDEAKLAASLDHPHIVQVYDMGRVDGNYFFTMEYVHGQDVRTILRQGSRTKHELPIAIAIQIARTVASALHHAHERRNADGTLRNIVHRDVSPSNILVSYDGAIKLADFGVAKAATSSVRTRTGALKGKVGYMAPEQARGGSIDRRSDVFSLGVVLWELVSMRRLFKSDNDLATIQAIINTPPPPLSTHRPDVPPELERITRKALAKEPAERYQSAQDLQRDLDEISRELKLDQSSIGVSSFMTEMFAHELAAIRAAQKAGITVTDFVVSASGVNAAENTTPVSESELSLDDPGDDPVEEEEDEPDVDVEEEISEATALPPRSGSIDRDEIEATDFGPPPTMLDSAVTAIPKPPVIAPPTRPTPIPSMPRPVEKNPFEEDNESLATRLRPNPMRVAPDRNFDDAAPTTVASPAFIEEAATVTAPPDIVNKAFAESAETVEGVGSFPDQGTSPFEPTAVQFEPMPVRRSEVPTTPVPVQPVGYPPPQYPHTPPVGVPPMGPGMYGHPGMHNPMMPGPMMPPNTPPMGMPRLDQTGPPFRYPMQDIDVNLAPHRRWLVIGGVAVVVTVIAIVLILLLGSSGPSEPVDEIAPDATVTEPRTKVDPPVRKDPPKLVAKPASPGSGSGSGSGSAEEVAPVQTPPSAKPTKPPTKRPVLKRPR